MVGGAPTTMFVTAVTLVVGTTLLAATFACGRFGVASPSSACCGGDVDGRLVGLRTDSVRPDREMAGARSIGPVVAGVAAFGVFFGAYLGHRRHPRVAVGIVQLRLRWRRRPHAVHHRAARALPRDVGKSRTVRTAGSSQDAAPPTSG